MPAGDGVSLPTTLAQLGNVAKRQAKGQQTSAQTSLFSGEIAREEALKVRKVSETEELAEEAVDTPGQDRDRRKRRRLKRNQKRLAVDADRETLPEGTAAEEQLGILIDMRV